MLYESLSQPLIILCVFAVGIAAGMIFDVGKFVNYFFSRNKVSKQILLAICTVASALLLYFVNLKVNFGRFRFYILVLFTLALIVERFTIGKLWTKLLEKCYNKLVKLKTWLNGKLNGRKKQEKQN